LQTFSTHWTIAFLASTRWRMEQFRLVSRARWMALSDNGPSKYAFFVWNLARCWFLIGNRFFCPFHLYCHRLHATMLELWAEAQVDVEGFGFGGHLGYSYSNKYVLSHYNMDHWIIFRIFWSDTFGRLHWARPQCLPTCERQLVLVGCPRSRPSIRSGSCMAIDNYTHDNMSLRIPLHLHASPFFFSTIHWGTERLGDG
jgi:hypothetical protein